MNDYKTNVRDRLIEFFTSHVEGFRVDQTILSQLDSVAVYTLIPLIEREFEIEIYSLEITSADFETISALSSLIERKLTKRTAPPPKK